VTPMEWYSPEEVRIYSLALKGNHAEAQAMAEALAPSLTPGRRALLFGQLYYWENPARKKEAAAIYIEGIKESRRDPTVLAMLLVEASLVGYRLNDKQYMRELWMLTNQLTVAFPGDQAITYWYGSILLNFANYLVRNVAFQEALPILDEALRRLEGVTLHWCHITRAHYLRSWCLAELGRLSDAKDALREMLESDRSNRHHADYLLGRSRIARAEHDYEAAFRFAHDAQTCAIERELPDWQIVVEAAYQRLLITIAVGGDYLSAAIEARDLASKYGIDYVVWLVEQSLAQFATGRREVIS
jgi:tetratricopeptide (TPR) repeat protein